MPTVVPSGSPLGIVGVVVGVVDCPICITPLPVMTYVPPVTETDPVSPTA